jgi:hypothetical protein
MRRHLKTAALVTLLSLATAAPAYAGGMAGVLSGS